MRQTSDRQTSDSIIGECPRLLGAGHNKAMFLLSPHTLQVLFILLQKYVKLRQTPLIQAFSSSFVFSCRSTRGLPGKLFGDYDDACLSAIFRDNLDKSSPFGILRKLRMTELVVTTGTIRRAKLESNRHHQQANTQLFTSGHPSCRPVS